MPVPKFAYRASAESSLSPTRHRNTTGKQERLRGQYRPPTRSRAFPQRSRSHSAGIHIRGRIIALGDRGACVPTLREVLNEYGQGILAARTERRYAREASGQLLELYRKERRERRELNHRALYQSIVAQRLGPQARRAAEIIRRA